MESEKVKQRVLSKLNEIAKEYLKIFKLVSKQWLKGSVYDKVCEVADMISADLIVMGTNGSPKGIAKSLLVLMQKK